MTDPYEVLNIPTTASDEEVKKAYHALARKYHPDNYHDNPLADLAQEKMKEVNAAYDAIQRERSGRTLSGPGSSRQSYGGGAAYQQQRQQQNYGQGYAQRPYQDASQSQYAQILSQVRWAIRMGGSLEQVERMLASIPEPARGGEWNFLMGQIYYRRGWVDEARQYYQIACAREPGNSEYREALNYLNHVREAYRPEGYNMSSTCGGGELCGRLACACLLCNPGNCFLCC